MGVSNFCPGEVTICWDDDVIRGGSDVIPCGDVCVVMGT